MAKAIKSSTKAASSQPAASQAPQTGAEGNEVKASSKKQMSKEQAQAIVDQHSGINGAFVPAELKQAREVLKAQ